MIKEIIITIKDFYFKYLSCEDKSWYYLRQNISKSNGYSLEMLKSWEQKSKISFDEQKFSELLQISFLTNQHLISEYLLNEKKFVYPFLEIPRVSEVSKISFLDGFMTRGLLKEDHAAWLGLIVCHHPFHLLELEKDYDYTEYHYITKKFFFHPSFKNLYMDKERRRKILDNCPTNATIMLKKIFLEMDLEKSHSSKKNIKI